MHKRDKYKTWKIGDFKEILKMREKNMSCKEIALCLGITRNCLYKAIKRYEIYKKIQGPSLAAKLCSLQEVYKIARDLGIENGPIIEVLQKINASRQNTSLPRIIMAP